jgi:hypothetical protein
VQISDHFSQNRPLLYSEARAAATAAARVPIPRSLRGHTTKRRRRGSKPPAKQGTRGTHFYRSIYVTPYDYILFYFKLGGARESLEEDASLRFAPLQDQKTLGLTRGRSQWYSRAQRDPRINPLCLKGTSSVRYGYWWCNGHCFPLQLRMNLNREAGSSGGAADREAAPECLPYLTRRRYSCAGGQRIL